MKQLFYLLGYYAFLHIALMLIEMKNCIVKKFSEEAWLENDICFEMNIPQKYKESCLQKE